MSPLSLPNLSAILSSKPTSSPPSRPTIILVHGGWQGPETYSLLLPLLERAGYSVFAPTLPSAGTVPAVLSFASDVSILRNAISSTLAVGKDVILVMHSYGAVVGCEALKGVKIDETDLVVAAGAEGKVGKVRRLVFIAGLLLPEGKSTRNSGRGDERLEGFECQDNLIRMTDGPKRFFNDLPPANALCWASKLKKHSLPAFLSPLTYAAYRDYPSSYLLCINDNAIPLAIQKRFVAMAGIQDTVEVQSGHLPQVSQPKLVEMFIRKCAGEEAARL
ncbi:MAG: hypothetical protein Q9170_005361 [Blastenia crenularia]